MQRGGKQHPAHEQLAFVGQRGRVRLPFHERAEPFLRDRVGGHQFPHEIVPVTGVQILRQRLFRIERRRQMLCHLRGSGQPLCTRGRLVRPPLFLGLRLITLLVDLPQPGRIGLIDPSVRQHAHQHGVRQRLDRLRINPEFAGAVHQRLPVGRIALREFAGGAQQRHEPPIAGDAVPAVGDRRWPRLRQHGGI